MRHNARDKVVGVKRNSAAQCWNRGADSCRKFVIELGAGNLFRLEEAHTGLLCHRPKIFEVRSISGQKPTTAHLSRNT